MKTIKLAANIFNLIYVISSFVIAYKYSEEACAFLIAVFVFSFLLYAISD